MNLEPLADNLQQQVSLHESLLNVLEKESKLPASCTLDELESVQSGKIQIVDELKKLEQSRKDVLQQYADENHLKKGISLQEIIADAGKDPCQENLLKTRQNLLEVVDTVRKLGHENASTASARLLSIYEVQTATHKAFHRSPVYSQRGMVTELKGACLVQKKI